MKRIVITAFALLAVAMTACVKEPEHPAQPTKQPVSLTGTAWIFDAGGSYNHSTQILRFLTDSTGTEYFFKKDQGEILVDVTRPIGYQFDSLTHEGRYYTVGHPTFFYEFTYNAADTTLTYHSVWGDMLFLPLPPSPAIETTPLQP